MVHWLWVRIKEVLHGVVGGCDILHGGCAAVGYSPRRKAAGTASFAWSAGWHEHTTSTLPAVVGGEKVRWGCLTEGDVVVLHVREHGAVVSHPSPR